MQRSSPKRWVKLGSVKGPFVAVVAISVLALTPSVASAAPSVTTLPASQIDKNSAYVCGQWSSDQPGFTEFEWGTSTSYGTVAGLAATDSNYTSGSDCITLTGLTPGTSYRYRFVFLVPNSSDHPAACPCDEYDGGDQSFTTNPGYRPVITGPTTATVGTDHDGFFVTTAIDAGGYPTTWQLIYGTSPTNLSSSTPGPATTGGNR